MSVLPGAEPFSHAAGEVGVLLCHGFTGTPQSLRGWGEALAEAGCTVELPLLPGHGTRWQDMNRSTWKDWYGAVDASFTGLRARCSTVVVAGLSMGGGLALRLAAEHPDEVDGLVLVNPAVKIENPLLPLLPVLRWVVPFFPAIASDIAKPGVTELAYDRTPLHAVHSMLAMYAEIRPRLPQVVAPLVLLRSAVDHVVPASSSKLILDTVGSTDVTEIVLADSYHVATLDHDADRIVKESLALVDRIAPGRAR